MDSSTGECWIARSYEHLAVLQQSTCQQRCCASLVCTEQRSCDSCRVDRMLAAQCLVPDISVGELNTTARMLNDNVASQPELERPFEDDVFNCDPDFRYGRCTA